MSIQLGRMQQLFTHYDANRDGKLDRTETAQGALSLLGAGPAGDALVNNTLSPEALAQFQTEGSLFATMVQGGVDGQGLNPDQNGDGIDMQELARLASADGNQNEIAVADFRTAFGARFKEGGNAINLDGLKQVASQSTLAQQFANQATQVAANPQDGGIFQQFASVMMMMMQMLMTLFGGQQR